jgi:hypothetical protein
MPRITLPEGARAVNMADPRRYTAGPGDQVEVSPGHAANIRRLAQRVRSGERFALGTRRGRHCGPCDRLWNVWSAACPRCGAATAECP